MGKPDRKKKLAGPWRRLHTVVWLLGLAILAWQDWWWPGILVLVAISIMIEELIPAIIPRADEADTPQETTLPARADEPAPAMHYRLDLLPSVCPNCNGPIRGHEIKWTGRQSADCPYCGSNLPMAKVQG